MLRGYIYSLQNRLVMETFLAFDFGDGSRVKFGFSSDTTAESLAAMIQAAVNTRLALRNVQGIGKKSRAWSGRRFMLSAQIAGKDCTAGIYGMDYSALHTDWHALATAAINGAREYGERMYGLFEYSAAPVREKVTAELN